MTTGDVLAFLARRLSRFTPSAAPEPLSGGYLNRVWRVKGHPASVVVKHAPEWSGSLAIDPSRVAFEARALEALDVGGRLAHVPTKEVQVPRLRVFDSEAKTLVMEDLGTAPTLDVWLLDAALGEAHTRGQMLGRFIGRLHAVEVDPLRVDFDNAPIQRTRFDVQYASIGAALHQAGIADWESLGARARALGRALQRPGSCLVMGDLWPRSVLVRPADLRVIDWEMVHVGQPWQDTAHLGAHLWMLAHRHPQARSATEAFRAGFNQAYGDERRERLLEEFPAARWHAGCELIVRTLGPFQAGYLFDGLAGDSLLVREAVRQALYWLRTDPPA